MRMSLAHRLLFRIAETKRTKDGIELTFTLTRVGRVLVWLVRTVNQVMG